MKPIASKTQTKASQNRVEEIRFWIKEYNSDSSNGSVPRQESIPVPASSPYYQIFLSENESDEMRKCRSEKTALTSYAILDDEDLNALERIPKDDLVKRFIRTDSKIGFTESDADKLIDLLLSDSSPL
jgi:hypothetical protein